MQPVTKGVIVAAGMGTRFLPATKAIPKEMIPVLDKPVLQYIVEEMVVSGITDIMLVTGRGKEAIERHFTPDPALQETLKGLGKLDRIQSLIDLHKKVRLYYTYQEKPLGNGHALLCAKAFCGNEPFAFSDGDSIIDAKVPVVKQLKKVFTKYNAPIIGVQRIEDKEAMTKYGNVYAKPEKERRTYRVQQFIEKPAVDKVSEHGLIVGGMRYIFTPDIWKYLEVQGKGKGGEIWVADAANLLAQKKKFFAYEYEGTYFDTGNEIALLKTAMHFAKDKL